MITVQNNKDLENEIEKAIRTIRVWHLRIEDAELTKFAIDESVAAWTRIRSLRF